jgi:hypothetical protein
MPLIENLSVPQLFPGGLIRALDTLRENKRVEHRVPTLRTASADLNDTIEGRSNNSFDRSAS